MKTKVIILDHFDSFTYNLVVYLERLGASVSVFRTDSKMEVVEKNFPTHVVLSPGPGHPKDVSLFQEALTSFKEKVPILGVCLGEQSIGLHFGARVERCQKVMHGKTSCIKHTGTGLFKNIPNQLDVCRYHSLAIVPESIIPGTLEVTAETEDGIVMAIETREYPNVVGVQFHPESLFTEFGMEMLENFLSM